MKQASNKKSRLSRQGSTWREGGVVSRRRPAVTDRNGLSRATTASAGLVCTRVVFCRALAGLWRCTVA